MVRFPTGTAGRIAALALLLLLIGAAGGPVLGAPEIPARPQGRVNDYAGLLDPAAEAGLERRLADIEAGTSNQFVVAIFESLDGESLEEFSLRLAERWGVGHKGRDNGILLLLFTRDQKIRIEVGYGLEGVITDALSGRVIRTVMAPRFRQGDYAGGLVAAVEALDAASRGEFEALPPSGRTQGDSAALVLVPLFFAFLLLSAILSRRRVAHLGRHSRRAHPGGFWWMGPGGFGGGRGFGGGGFGGGGFGGGGGGFGGGGASGGW